MDAQLGQQGSSFATGCIEVELYRRLKRGHIGSGVMDALRRLGGWQVEDYRAVHLGRGLGRWYGQVEFNQRS
jgi:hypothetical protein